MVDILKSKFKRSAAVVKSLKSGRLFDYDTYKKVTATCDQNIAEYINDREWFKEQKASFQKNGDLNISFENISKRAIKSWINSFNGAVEVISPESLRQEIRQAAEKLLARHK